MLSEEFWRSKSNWQESEVRSQELEEEKMSEPLMAVMILIFMINLQECVEEHSVLINVHLLFSPLYRLRERGRGGGQ